MLSEGVETPSAGRLPCNAHNVEQAVANIGQSMQSQDRLFVILIGHGSADGIVAKFNLPGPDLRDLDFARILELLPARRQVFINTTAASGGFIEKLSRPDRIIITATRGPEENFATKFPEFFVEALEHSDVVDLNKDHQISLLEVFDYARDQVVRFYEQANRLRPEHPLLDDNGDGAGSETPMAVVPVSNQGASTLHLDGALAAQVLWTARAAAISSVPAAASAAENTLIARKMKLLLEIEALKTQKASLPIAEYERNLEALFIELAKLNREIKKTASP